jgi:hypothetical protein
MSLSQMKLHCCFNHTNGGNTTVAYHWLLSSVRYSSLLLTVVTIYVIWFSKPRLYPRGIKNTFFKKCYIKILHTLSTELVSFSHI